MEGETPPPATVYDQRMQIIGIGLDATEIPRIASTMERYGDRFLRRIFTAGEIAYCQAHRRAAQHFAARFAVKEAAMKALGTGHSRGVLWKDVEVERHGGPPQLRLHGAAGRRFVQMGGRSSAVTITHTDTLAMAQVILMGGRED
jgi:holo-[acyl-carrier protein] synthase